MNITNIISRLRWPSQRHSAAWLPSHIMNRKVGRVTPCAPGLAGGGGGAPGVTRPTTANRFRGSMRELSFLAILTLCLLGGLLTARGQDPYITLTNYPLHTNVSLGVPVSFRVFANSTNLPMTYQWQHEGTNLPAATNSLLVISNLTVAHAGGYVAWITNASGGFTNSRTAILAVDSTFTKITQGRPATDQEGSTSVTWVDYDQDGWLDLFVGNAGSGVLNSLYRNNGDGTFSKITTNLLGSVAGSAWGVAWGDYDNDGGPDLFVANHGNRLPSVFHNEGGGRFTRVTSGALVTTPLDGIMPLWGDYDNDGFIDLFLSTGYHSGPQNDRLYHNEGGVAFRTVTAAEVGVAVSDNAQDQAFGWIDYDNDGDLDLFVAYMAPPFDGPASNFVFRNSLNGPFEKVALTDFDVVRQCWGATWGDYDNDGYPDVFLPSWFYTNALFKNLQGQGFTNAAAPAGLELVMASEGSAWGDYDNDGWLDLYVGNYEGQTNYPGGSALFHNNHDGTFTRITSGSPANEGGRVTAVAWGDYDNDGFLDVYVACGDGTAQRNLFYRNNGNSNHWLKVNLVGKTSNRLGIGAKVKVLANIGAQSVWQLRSITGQHSWVGDNGLLAHFGLGDATNVTALRIEWPSGIVQVVTNVAANQFLTVVESQGYAGAPPEFSDVTNGSDAAQLSFTEPLAGSRYILEASSNLVTWTKLMARTSAGSTAQFTDTGATNYTRRFYRLQVP